MPRLALDPTSRACRSSVTGRSRNLPFTCSALPPAAITGSSPAISRRCATAAAASAAAALTFLHPSNRAMSSPVSAARDVSAGAGPAASSPSASSPVAGSPANLDLLVVGPGVLGSVLAKDWLESVPGSTATGLTNSDKSHDRLRAMGLTPATRDTLPAGRKWSFVVFAAPPSGSQDYVADVKAALSLWDGSGSFLFTSSMSVCAVDDGGQVTDTDSANPGEGEGGCPLVAQGAAPSTDRLLGAEQATLQAGGNVLRLVGLYHTNRGAHTYFIKTGTVARPGGYVVNLLHYEDAAGMGAAILRGDGTGPFRGRVLFGTDGVPVTFEDMVEVCFSSGVFPRVPVNFTGSFPEGGSTGRGKRVSNSASRTALGGWSPRYPSFADFMRAGGKDFYNTSGLGF
ncbi:hypothetical protein PLESTB_001649100 [Pleodorina starrii]|uniref:Uncharacterized protein n=1 Tax=Pleodorina starrii TaxID=330485 RepID=A0A9W6BYK3_9CHLO|nr:hypothetical protein PLESTM_000872000 [Pleodorina starrii]GLC60623.1 hypothetical protein PLESTB_001649100 [Pleodorina starrii]GLC68882.1 hypothetical protein PLESTF_000753800 [Pleodorina starrii]